MKYLCLVYLDEKKLGDVPDRECKACGDALRKSGHHIAAEALQPVHTATTVRVRNGNVSVTDGPFAETKEHLAGFYLVDAKDLIFFFNDTATTEIYTLSLHDALPI